MQPSKIKFQHTAARRRLHDKFFVLFIFSLVSTHSRPKAAAGRIVRCVCQISRFNTQPPEGGCWFWFLAVSALRGFNTQPPEGGCKPNIQRFYLKPWFQHTAARRRLPTIIQHEYFVVVFQHTAARRRLLSDNDIWGISDLVSTHSRPKAAAPYIKK